MAYQTQGINKWKKQLFYMSVFDKWGEKFTDNVCWAKPNWLFLKLRWREQHLWTALWVMLQLAVYTVALQTFNVISFLQARTNYLPKAIVKREWRRLRPACVFNTSHQGVAFKNRVLIGVNLHARYSLIALTPTWDKESDFPCDGFAVMEERRGKNNQS